MDASSFVSGARKALKGTGLTIRPACAADVAEIGRNLRKSDLAECAFFKLDGFAAAMESHTRSDEFSMVVLDEATDTPIAAFGVAGRFTFCGFPVRQLWLFGTAGLNKAMRSNAKAAVKLGRYTVKKLVEEYGYLGNVIPNVLMSRRAKYLLHLGASFQPLPKISVFVLGAEAGKLCASS